MNEHFQELVLLPSTARELRVPAPWLRGEIDAGRIPCLRAGRRILLHVPTVRALLLKQATASVAPDNDRGLPPQEVHRGA